MAAFWTLDRLATALSESYKNEDEGLTPGLKSLRGDRGFPRGQRSISSISTDTRTIKPNDCFVALIGDRFDGHDHIGAAIAGGASAIVVSRPPKLGEFDVPVYVVDDTLVALGQLAKYWRFVWGGKVVAVAGSNGKTSTKELVSAVLREKFEVHATLGNHNNRVGVPLTLLSLPASTQIAVVEVGTSLKGEIEILRNIVQPDISIVTNIGEEHLEGFGDLHGVLMEEASIADSVECVVVPDEFPELVEEVRRRTVVSDPVSKSYGYVVQAFSESHGEGSSAPSSVLQSGRVVSVGLESGDVHPSSWSIGFNGLGSYEINGVSMKPPFRGVHNLKNSLLAVAVGRLFGMSDDEIASGLSRAKEPEMRGRWGEFGKATIIDDTYNANPASMRTSLATLAGADPKTQKVAILGDMRELGPNSSAYHDEIVTLALNTDGVSIVAAVGEMGEALKRVGINNPKVVTAPEIDGLWAALAPRLDKSATILVKASRGVRLERIIPHIQAWANS